MPEAGIGPLRPLLTVASTRTAAAAAALARLVAIPAEDRTIATRLKRHCCRLAATGTDHRSSLCRAGAVAGATLIVFLCHTAILATFRGRITAFLKERLIGSGEGEVLPAIAASKLNISGHGSPRGNCTAQSVFCVQDSLESKKLVPGARSDLVPGIQKSGCCVARMVRVTAKIHIACDHFLCNLSGGRGVLWWVQGMCGICL
jgi:hypothetical protein